jgi:hypothetical protein
MTSASISAVSSAQTEDQVGSKKADKRRGPAATRSPPQISGMLWFAGWLFTIGFAKLVWWKALLGLVVWPYLLGITVR